MPVRSCKSKPVAMEQYLAILQELSDALKVRVCLEDNAD
jgi:hypothetical protein